MFAHNISSRQVSRLNTTANTEQDTASQVSKTYLSIAVGIAMSCLAVQGHAEDSIEMAATPEPEAVQVAEPPQVIYERLKNPDAPIDNKKLVSDEFVAQQTRLFFECTQVQLASARLACFDKVAEQGKTPSFTTTKQPLDLSKAFRNTFSGNSQNALAEDVTQMQGDTVDDAETVRVSHQLLREDNLEDSIDSSLDTGLQARNNGEEILETVGVSKNDIEKYTPLSLAYDLDQNSESGTWSARPYRPMYVLPLFLNAKPNRNPSTPTQEVEPFTPNEMRVPELKLQVSVKTKVAEDLFNTSADMWFGYTQQSHWQVYNSDNSRPFRATDYQPEIFLTQPVKADLPFGGRLRMLGAGAMHHSNGQDDPLSRSWNRVYLMGGAEWGKFSIVPRLWARVKTESSDEDDNPDIEDFWGIGDVKFLYDFENRQSVSGTLRYNPKTEKGSAQVDYIYPLADNVNGYVQLFHGYGESIIDYNHKNTAIGVGIMLNDWKGL